LNNAIVSNPELCLLLRELYDQAEGIEDYYYLICFYSQGALE